MAVVNKVLIPSKEMEAALTTQYTAPTTARTSIDKFTATNTSGSTAVISVHLCESGDTVDDTNKIVDNHSIAVDETYDFPELISHVLNASGFISTVGTASALTIRSSGREIT